MVRVHLVVIFGPPAVGKMTVGRVLCERTGYKLFHNHMTIEPVLELFAFGSRPFVRLVEEFRRRVMEEACDAELDGLVFTYVWGVDEPAELAVIQGYVDIVESRGGRASFLELAADQDVRLERNRMPDRIEHKRSKKDVERSEAILLGHDDQHVMNTGEGVTHAERLLNKHPWHRIDSTHLTPAEVAEQAVAALKL